jgi:hypothetical protein
MAAARGFAFSNKPIRNLGFLDQGALSEILWRSGTFGKGSQLALTGGRRCTGHFVDLPMGQEVDRLNREIIASDQSLS